MTGNVVLNSDSHSSLLIRTFSDLYKNNVLTDVTLFCDDRYRIEAHRMVLCASSPLLRDFITMNAQSHPLIYLKGVKGQSLSTIMQFLYTGEVSINQEELPSLLEVSKELEIDGLQEKQDIQKLLRLRQDNSLKEDEVSSCTDIPPSSNVTLNKPDNILVSSFNCGDCEYRGKSHKQLLAHMEKLHTLDESASKNDEASYDLTQEALDAVDILEREPAKQEPVTELEQLFTEDYGMKTNKEQKSKIRIIESAVHKEFSESSKDIVVKNKRKTIWRSECLHCSKVIDNKKSYTLKQHLHFKHREVFAAVQLVDGKKKQLRMEELAKNDGLKPILDGLKIELALVQSKIQKAKGHVWPRPGVNLTELFFKEAELKSKIQEF